MKQRIINHIHKHGPMSVADYMAMCLYDPDEGYYTTKNPFGSKKAGDYGDFLTAPEMTPLFGEMLGLWVASIWQQMGEPETFNLIELGPGRGVLSADMLRALQKAAPACLAACRLHLVEISPKLKGIQRETLKDAPCPTHWHTDITQTPQENAIALGNELMDALPVKQYEKGNDGSYYERLVTAKEGELALTLAKEPTDIAAHTQVTEHSTALDDLLKDIKTHLKEGVLLLLDYGAPKAEEGSTGETLQAIQKHQHENIFAAPGEADITWHIPFNHVIDILGHDKCVLTDMGLFLAEIGLPVRAEQAHRAAKTPEQQKHIEDTTRRLLDPNQMGRHFKVLCWQGQRKLNPPGFSHLQI